jgi:thioester reductase-like protein
VNPTQQTGAGERVVLTGATGFLGQQILRVLLERRPEAHLALLVRETADKSAGQRLEALLERCCEPDARNSARRRIEVFAADTAAEHCGLSARDWAAVAGGATRVIHSAAAVRFDAPPEEARRANVGGVRNLLDVAEAAGRSGSLRSFTHVSTAYVAGRRTGIVREDELDAGQRFRNTYELTKCEAEGLVRARVRDLPVVIARPSIVVGDSRTGVTTSFHTMYWPLRAYVQKRWRIVPGRPQTPIDMVPVDFVAEATVHLAWSEQAVGRSLHLCAGPARSSTIGEVAGAAARFFRLPPPRFVNPVLFMALLRPLLELTVWGPRRHILKKGWFYRPYLDMQLEFDTAQADSLLAPAGIQPPRVMDYLERLFKYCLDSDWGRRPPALRTPS